MVTARQRAREAMLPDITDEARRQLARDGAAGLSLRSVARELGVVSSAVYRYVSSRDALLTLLIVEGYDRLADAAERAQRRAGEEPLARWRAACTAIRSWARAQPHEYALLYGTPVPGYAAPEDTIGPARRVYETLVDPVRRAPSGRRSAAARVDNVDLSANAERVASDLGLDIDPARLLRVLGAIAQVFGLVSFELFGHTKGVVDDHERFFAHQVDALADAVGLPVGGAVAR